MPQKDARAARCGDIRAIWVFGFQTSHHSYARVLQDNRKIQDIWRSSSPTSSSGTICYEKTKKQNRMGHTELYQI